MTTLLDRYRHPVLPERANYSFTAHLCGHKYVGKARLPESADRFSFGMRAVFKSFLKTVIGGGYSIIDVEQDHRFVWRAV